MKKQSYLEINPKQFEAFKKLPMNEPVVMLNLLKFKDLVPETQLTGAESYKEYMHQAAPFFAKADGEILFLGKPQAMLIGPEEESLWDKILLVKYNSLAGFLRMVQSEGYPAHLRAQSLADSRLISCKYKSKL